MSLFTHFGGANKQRTINLGNSSGAGSPDTVIARARAERQARERLRKEEVATRKIQRIWRGRKVAQRTRQELLSELKSGNLQREQAARALAVILWNGIGGPEDLQGLRMLSSWAREVVAESSGEFGCVRLRKSADGLGLIIRSCGVARTAEPRKGVSIHAEQNRRTFFAIHCQGQLVSLAF